MTTPARGTTSMSSDSSEAILLAAGGDLMLYGRYQTLADAGRTDWVLESFREIVGDCDLLVANLENPVTTQGADGSLPQLDKLCLRADPAWAGALRQAGVDVVNLANNHIQDFGLVGLTETRQLLSAAGVAATGAGSNLAQASEPVLIERNGIRLGLLGACDVSTKPGPSATSATAGVVPLQPDLLLPAISALKRRVDHVVLMLHWGLEYSPLPTPEQVAFAHAAVDHGASLILGHHSHCIQGVEQYGGAVIAYSLANLTDDRVDVQTPARHYYAELTDTDRESFLLRVRLDQHGVSLLDPVPLWLDDAGRPQRADGERAAKLLMQLDRCGELLRNTPNLQAYWEDSVIDRRVSAPLLSWWRDGNLFDKVRRFRLGQLVSAWRLLETFVQVKFSRSQSRWLLYSERNDTRPMPAVRTRDDEH